MTEADPIAQHETQSAAGQHSVRQHLRLEINEYDETIRRWIPNYEEFIKEAAKAVAEVEPKLVLDLGAGTGALSEAILRHEAVGQVELTDVDPEMLDQARDRLAHAGDRARFALRSYYDPLPACDAMAASISLHHIPSIEEKESVYANVFAALRPGGVLVNADCSMPGGSSDEEAAERERLYQVWVDHQVSHGISAEQARRHFAEWAEEDTYLPLEEELAALRRVGFETEIRWQRKPFSVVVARKPS